MQRRKLDEESQRVGDEFRCIGDIRIGMIRDRAPCF